MYCILLDCIVIVCVNQQERLFETTLFILILNRFLYKKVLQKKLDTKLQRLVILKPLYRINYVQLTFINHVTNTIS